MESWTEIRCIACIQLNYPASRLLLKVNGRPSPDAGVKLRMKCQRCKSIIEWTLGLPVLIIIEKGIRNNTRRVVNFE